MLLFPRLIINYFILSLVLRLIDLIFLVKKSHDSAQELIQYSDLDYITGLIVNYSTLSHDNHENKQSPCFLMCLIGQRVPSKWNGAVVALQFRGLCNLAHFSDWLSMLFDVERQCVDVGRWCVDIGR